MLPSTFDLLPSVSFFFNISFSSRFPFHVLSQKKGFPFFFFFPLKRKKFGKRILYGRGNDSTIQFRVDTMTRVDCDSRSKIIFTICLCGFYKCFSLLILHRDDLRNGKQGRRINATKTILDVFRRTYRGFPPRSSQGGGPQALNAR